MDWKSNSTPFWPFKVLCSSTRGWDTILFRHGWFHMKGPRKTWFFWIFTKKVKSFWYFINKKKTCFKPNFGYFWPLLEVFKDFLSFEVFKNEIFSIMFNYSVTGQNHSKFLQFSVFKGHFCSSTTLYTFWCFSPFWSPRLPRISNFQPASLLQLFQPSNHFDQKNCGLGV